MENKEIEGLNAFGVHDGSKFAEAVDLTESCGLDALMSLNSLSTNSLPGPI
jgi:hypothetical protein